MNLDTFTQDPPGVEKAVLRRRLLLICASSGSALVLFFGLTMLLYTNRGLLWVVAISLIGFLPMWHAWLTGSVARLKIMIFGIFVPVAIMAAFMILIVGVCSIWHAIQIH